MVTREGFVESLGHKIAYISYNEHLKSKDEPPYVFIHGALASVKFWDAFVPHTLLKDKYWVSLGLPAHYPSIAPKDFTSKDINTKWFDDIMGLCLKELFADEKVIVLGHSTGGFVTLKLAINKCPNLLGIISVCSFHKGDWNGVEGLLFKSAQLGKWFKPLFVMNKFFSGFKIIQKLFIATTTYKMFSFLFNNPLAQKLNDDMYEHVAKQDYNAIFELFNGISKVEIKNQLASIDIPIVLFTCLKDPIISNDQSLFIVSRVPKSVPYIFEDCGHLPFVEKNEEFNLAFVKAVNYLKSQSKK